jgi:hypothetical protein
LEPNILNDVGSTIEGHAMNHSLVTADRNTHLKMVVVALVAAIMVVSVGIAARVSNSSLDLGTDIIAARPGEHAVKVGVVKASKPVAITSSGASTVR